MIETIRWQRQWGRDDVVVWLDVAKADRAWQSDADYYIAAGGPGSEWKYRKFGEWLEANPAFEIWMPHVSLRHYTMHFTDGRHRFAWMRDHGAETLPVTIAPAQAARLQSWLGAARPSNMRRKPV